MQVVRVAARLIRDEAGSTMMEYGMVGMMVLIGAALLLQRLLTGTPIR